MKLKCWNTSSEPNWECFTMLRVKTGIRPPPLAKKKKRSKILGQVPLPWGLYPALSRQSRCLLLGAPTERHNGVLVSCVFLGLVTEPSHQRSHLCSRLFPECDWVISTLAFLSPEHCFILHIYGGQGNRSVSVPRTLPKITVLDETTGYSQRYHYRSLRKMQLPVLH